MTIAPPRRRRRTGSAARRLAQRAEEVHAHHVADPRRRQPIEASDGEHPGVVDHAVEAAETPHRRPHRALGVACDGDIRAHEESAVALRAQPPLRPASARSGALGDHHREAGRAKASAVARPMPRPAPVIRATRGLPPLRRRL